MSAAGLLVAGGSGDDRRGHGSHDARGAGPRGTVRDFFWQGDGIQASRSSMSQDTAGAGRRDNGVAGDAVPIPTSPLFMMRMRSDALVLTTSGSAFVVPR